MSFLNLIFRNILLLLLLFHNESYADLAGSDDDDSSYEFTNPSYDYMQNIYINESTIALPNLAKTVSRTRGIFISGNVRISVRELEIFFHNLNMFEGISVNGTNLENIKFLHPYMFIMARGQSKYNFNVTNNKNMTSLGINFNYCTYCSDWIRVENNPILDMRNECDGLIKRYASNREISGNLYDCGCTIPKNLKSFLDTLKPNCEWLFGNLTLEGGADELDYDFLMKKLAGVKRISGGLSVKNTRYPDLKFLKNLQKIETNTKSSYMSYITIMGNPNMTSLGIKFIRDGPVLYMSNNSKLCVSPQELVNLYLGVSPDSDLDVKVCFEGNTNTSLCEMPKSGKLADLPDTCKYIYGDVVLDDNFDFNSAYKIFEVEKIFGSLTIKKTKLRKLNMLFKLRYIYSTRTNTSVLDISDNPFIKYITMNQFSSIESGVAVTIRNNSQLYVADFVCMNWRTRKATVVKNNLVDCGISSGRNATIDKTPLNIDVFVGVPIYHDVSRGVQNNPGNILLPSSNTTEEEAETETSTPAKNTGKIFEHSEMYSVVLILFFGILL